jgi:hypothetical protein
MLTAPPGADGKDGAPPAAAGGIGSTLIEEGEAFFPESSFRISPWTVSKGARTSAASFFTQATLPSFALSSSPIFFLTSVRKSALRNSTSTAGRKELHTNSEVPSTAAREAAAQRMFPG